MATLPPLAAVYPPGVDPTKLHLAYGRRAIPKLVSELSVPGSDGAAAAADAEAPSAPPPDLYTRQKALVSLSALLRNPENISQALHASLAPALKVLIADSDLTVRQKSTELLVHFAGHSIGRSAIVEEKDLLPTLACLFDDPDILVRTNAHQVFVRVTAHKNCVLSLAAFQEETRKLPDARILDTTKNRDLPQEPTTGFVPVLVQKVATEDTCIRCLALQTLYGLIRFHQGFAVDALQVRAVTVFTGLLLPPGKARAGGGSGGAAHPPPPATPAVPSAADLASVPRDLKIAACKTLMALCFYPDGKRLACSEGSVPILVGLLGDGKKEVRAAAAGALMSITVNIEAKRIMVRDSLYKPLITLLDDKSDTVKINAIKTITNCAEDYRGRFAFQVCIKQLEEKAAPGPRGGDAALTKQKQQQLEQLREAAKKAVEVITWRP